MRIAVIGAGAIGRTHIETIAAVDGFEPAGIADPFDAAGALAERFGTRHHRSHRELIERGRPDAAIIATPNETHVEIALEFLAAGIPVLVEKPVATSAREADALVAASEETGVPVLVGHHRRHHPAVRRAADIVRSGGLGRIVAANTTYYLAKPADYFSIDWHRTAGTGGVFLINLVHEIDLLRYLVGEIVTVSALSSNAVRGLPVEDTGALTFAFEGGALGSLVITDAVSGPWSWDLTAGDSERFPRHPVDSHLIGGTQASLTLPRVEVWSHEGDPDWTRQLRMRREPVAAENPYEAQLRHFGEVVSGHAEPLVSAREGQRNVVVMEAVQRAVVTRTAVDLPQ